MRGKTAFGMVVVMALLFGAVLAPNASAEEEPPAAYWAECVKTSVKHTGQYEEKKCKKQSASGTGNYELKPGIGHGGGFTGKAGAESPYMYMQTASGLINLECKKSTDSGKYGLPSRMSDLVFTASKCHGVGALSAQTCTSPGAAAGTIQLSPLGGALGYIEYSKGFRSAVGFLMESEAAPGGLITRFSCGSELEVRVSGQLIVEPLSPQEANKSLYLTDSPGNTFLAEREYNGKKYAPLTNKIGFQSELNEIKLGERPPHVLIDELCGPYIERLEGETCTPPLYMAVAYIFKDTGEPLEIVNFEEE